MADIFLFLDESGKAHKNNPCTCFFIGGFITRNRNCIKHIYKKEVNKIKKELGKTLDYELKSTHMNFTHKIRLIKALEKNNDFIYTGIRLNKPLLRKKVDNENLYVNYLIKILIEYLIKENIISNDDTVNLLIDNQSISVGSFNTLKDYLLIYNRFELGNDININVTYIQSHHDYNIQISDLICNILWSKYEYPSTDKTSSSMDINKIKIKNFP